MLLRGLMRDAQELRHIVETGALFEQADAEGIPKAVRVTTHNFTLFEQAAQVLREAHDGPAGLGREDIRPLGTFDSSERLNRIRMQLKPYRRLSLLRFHRQNAVRNRRLP